MPEVDDPATDAALGRVTGALGAGEDRPSQRAMAAAVAAAVRRRRHLVVQAGTGTGKTLGYLVPVLVAGARVVVATATKALQDQLATRDLPLLESHLGVPFTWAVLKGRSNYLCRQRAGEVAGAGDQPEAGVLDGMGGPGPGPAGGLGPLGREVRRLVEWGERAETGDRAELEWEPSPQAWAQVSVGVRDCPGRARCPSGEICFAEAARDRASKADVVVVNTHLYATHLGAGGGILPAHDVVVFDEAHELEDIASASLGFEVTGGRLQALARTARPLVPEGAVAESVGDAGAVLAESLSGLTGTRLEQPLPAPVDERLRLARQRTAELSAALRKGRDADGSDEPRRQRAQRSAGNLVGDLDLLAELSADKVAWVEGPPHAPVLRVAPLDVGATLSSLLWGTEGAPTAVLTSATIPPGLAGRIGLPPGSFDELDVGSPFRYAEQALLYCALHLPDPRQPAFEPAMTAELVALIEAAGGRTLALFTSWRAMERAAAAVRDRVAWPVLTQSDLPKPALVARFAAEEHSCLFATMGFWQGVDVPGPSLSMVVIDKLPFPRPDDPLLGARRERLGRDAFSTIDVPRAATLLAQGAGRLIRSGGDRGVVAVLDRRLGTARYRWDLVRALPPMRRTRQLADVLEFLAPLRAGAQ